jgi:hypothetical protein
LVIGTTPAACPSGGVCKWPVRELYWTRGRCLRAWEEPETHHDAEELVGEVAGGRKNEIAGVQSSESGAHRRRLGVFQLDWFDEETKKSMAELQSISWGLGVSSSDCAGSRLELGFRCSCRVEREREERVLGFPLGGGKRLYSHQGRRPSSGASEWWRWIERLQ